jgi:hypothetical protein
LVFSDGKEYIETVAVKKNYLNEEITWKRVEDAKFPFKAVFHGEAIFVRLNDFPAEHLYTLIANGAEVNFDDWPRKWKHKADSTKKSVGKLNAALTDLGVQSVKAMKRGMNVTPYPLKKQKRTTAARSGASKTVKAKDKRLRSG